MSILIALAGKPNCGKSTFFKAATLADVEIANYPFTTIKPNLGVSYVRAKCPCKELHLTCPKCQDGERFIAVELLDVAGLRKLGQLFKIDDADLGRFERLFELLQQAVDGLEFLLDLNGLGHQPGDIQQLDGDEALAVLALRTGEV